MNTDTQSNIQKMLGRFFAGLQNDSAFACRNLVWLVEPPERSDVDDSDTAATGLDKALFPHVFKPEVQYYCSQAPRVLISREAYLRMCAYVEIAGQEVGWLGGISRTANGDFFIEETFLLDQTVNAIETVLDAESIGALTLALIESGEGGLEKANKLRFWGHSHVRMGIAPSHTDEMTMRRFAGEKMPWYVRGIFNKRGQAQFTIYLYEQGLCVKDAAWAVVDSTTGQALPVMPQLDSALREQVFAEFMLKVKSKSNSNSN